MKLSAHVADLVIIVFIPVVPKLTIRAISSLHFNGLQLHVILVSCLPQQTTVGGFCFGISVKLEIGWIHEQSIGFTVQPMENLKHHHRIAEIDRICSILNVCKPRPVNAVFGAVFGGNIWAGGSGRA